MNIISPMADAPFYTEINAPGVSWAGSLAAFVTAAFALVLIILGVGFGLS